MKIVRMAIVCYHLSHDIASWSDITPFNKNDKPLVVYILNQKKKETLHMYDAFPVFIVIIPPALFVWMGILFSRCPSVRASVRASIRP